MKGTLATLILILLLLFIVLGIASVQVDWGALSNMTGSIINKTQSIVAGVHV